MDHEANIKIITESEWSEGTVFLLTKWERVCKYRKKAHYSSARNFGWKNKLLSIPTILISTILGSLSFIHPSFMEQSYSRMLSERNLQPEWSACVCNSYSNGASGSDLCQNDGTAECYPMNEDWSCPGDMSPCINTQTTVPTEAPTFNDCPAGGYCISCGTCSPGRCDDNSCPLFDEHCSCADGSCPSKVDLSICSTTTPTISPSTTPITSPSTTPITSPTPPFEGKSGGGDGDGYGDGEECAPGCPDDWPGDGVCDDSCFNSGCNYDDGDCPTTSPTNLPTTSSPTRRPTLDPTQRPTPVPTTTYSYDRVLSSAPTCDRNYENNATLFPYIIGGFNMFIALISALHAFLKYDTLEDRHHQYSRHFSNLQVDLETVLAKPVSQRGNAGTMIERYKTKYAILINNAPDLSETLEKTCCGVEDSVPIAIEMT